MKEILRNVEGFITVSAAIVLLWILISWGDVVTNNAPYEGRQPHNWNAFVLLTELD